MTFVGLMVSAVLVEAVGFGISRAAARTFPAKPSHLYIASGPDTPPGIISRVVADALLRSEHWTVVPEKPLASVPYRRPPVAKAKSGRLRDLEMGGNKSK